MSVLTRAVPALAAVFLTVAACSPADAVGPAAVGPQQVTDFDHADPAAIQHGGQIYSYATDGSSDTRRIRVIRADTAGGPYTQLGKALDQVPWATGDHAVMGPHVVHRGGSRFLMYFTTNPENGTQKCVGAAVSTSGPAGPFVPRANPLVCDEAQHGAIAPSYFHDPRTGNHYLLYKTNGPNAIRRIYLQGLTADGLSLSGGRTLLGERDFNYENPQIMYRQGKYFLFMSRNLYQSVDYKTTVNWADNVAGPYPASRAHDLLNKENTSVAGPASAELVTLADGRTMAFFHGWRQNGGACDSPRYLYIATITWGSAGDDPRLEQPNPGDAHC
jgi:arabinan endo-1,5-alpha-L-arabinosidase